MNCRSMWIIKKLNAICDHGQPWSCLIEYQYPKANKTKKKKSKQFFFFFFGCFLSFWESRTSVPPSCFKFKSLSREAGDGITSVVQILIRACSFLHDGEQSHSLFFLLALLKYLFDSYLSKEERNGWSCIFVDLQGKFCKFFSSDVWKTT